jgi:hypothetical protein
MPFWQTEHEQSNAIVICHLARLLRGHPVNGTRTDDAPVLREQLMRQAASRIASGWRISLDIAATQLMISAQSGPTHSSYSVVVSQPRRAEPSRPKLRVRQSEIHDGGAGRHGMDGRRLAVLSQLLAMGACRKGSCLPNVTYGHLRLQAENGFSFFFTFSWQRSALFSSVRSCQAETGSFRRALLARTAATGCY